MQPHKCQPAEYRVFILRTFAQISSVRENIDARWSFVIQQLDCSKTAVWSLKNDTCLMNHFLSRGINYSFRSKNWEYWFIILISKRFDLLPFCTRIDLKKCSEPNWLNITRTIVGRKTQNQIFMRYKNFFEIARGPQTSFPSLPRIFAFFSHRAH